MQFNANSIIITGIGFKQFDCGTLGQFAQFFTKAGAFVFCSGLAFNPFFHGSIVTDYEWLTKREFIDSSAVAMITPAPVVIIIGFIVYLVAGFPGTCFSAGNFLFCYLLTEIHPPYFKEISKNTSIKGFVGGIAAAVIVALGGAVIIFGISDITDTPIA